MSREHDKPGRRRRPLSADERALWSTITRSIAPLRPARRALAMKPEEDASVDDIAAKSSGAALPAPPQARRPVKLAEPSLAPLDRRLTQRLARGREAIDARIDLHGLTQSEAHDALARFLRSASAEGVRIVLVITGKGGARETDPGVERGVLRRQVPLWLKSPRLRDYVGGFAAAHFGHGGEGAIYVRIRRPRGKPA